MMQGIWGSSTWAVSSRHGVRWVNPHTDFLLDVNEGNSKPDGKTVKIWFGDPNAN